MNQAIMRNALLFRTAMEVLRDPSGPFRRARRCSRSRRDCRLLRIGGNRMTTDWRAGTLGFVSLPGMPPLFGWMTKRGGWTISPTGVATLDEYASADGLYVELYRRYREVDQRRKQSPV
jgi:hypothetical protein